MFEKDELALLGDALDILESGFGDLPETRSHVELEQLRPILLDVARRMQDNFPYPHPLYAGQMLKPPHPIARLAYALSMWINPNNHALDGGRASSAMEKSCVSDIAGMFGWDSYLGHLTSGGTMANLEALWVADQLHPGRCIVGSDQAHYTHERISGVLKIPYRSIVSDANACMDIDALETELKTGDVGTVVVTLGTTGLGAVDPLPGILELQATYGFRVHVDAAYGGYFGLSGSLGPDVRAAYDAMTRADSIVIDPHKHGLQPYGCGCVLFGDPSVGRFYKHDSGYTYFSSDELHLGEISLECSRAGSSAVGLWATHQLLPPVPGGEFAGDLDKCLQAARDLHQRLTDSEHYMALHEPMLDIVIWTAAGKDADSISAANQRVFDTAAERNLHLALIEMPAQFVSRTLSVDENAERVTCLRSVLMKPEHLEWVDEIASILDSLAES